MEIKLKSYCLVIIGGEKVSNDQLFKVSETKPNIINYKEKDITIVTFYSALSLSELNEYFKSFNLIFTLSISNTTEINLDDDNAYNMLFNGIHKIMDKPEKDDKLTFDDFKDITNHKIIITATPSGMNGFPFGDDFINEIFNSHLFKEPKKTRRGKFVPTEEYINMSKEDGMKLIDRLIDKGPKKLTKYDKDLINFLINK